MTQSSDADLSKIQPQTHVKEDESENAPLLSEEATASHEGDEESADDQDKTAPNPYLNELTTLLEQLTDPEAKLQHAIDFMEKSLAQSKTPHFKSFWQARDICLQLFKENLSATARTTLWTKYSDLSKEARRLKTLLDEQSAFAVEQIEIAIQALETALLQLDTSIEEDPAYTSSIVSQALEKRLPYYRKKQTELNLLNTHAARINALRKELIKTEMRVRKKNKFFQRLSVAGDRVFPRRKDLIKELSDHFIADVDAFISANFSENKIRESLFWLRDEIKALQGMAKVLTLNTQAFTHVRLRLSECWDKIKVLDKERKQERSQQKTLFKQNVEAVLQKIQAFNQEMQSGQLTAAKANEQLDEISSFMRGVELGRDEVKFLRDQLQTARQPLIDLMKSDEEKRQEQERERVRLKQQVAVELRQEVIDLVRTGNKLDADSLTKVRDALLEKIQESPLVKSEKQDLERLLKPLRDVISDKREEALLTLSNDDRQAVQQLREVLKQRQERRQAIRNQLEMLRKAAGASGVGFERAMEYNAQLSEEKERLEKMTQGIQEIEQKISALAKRA